MRRLKELRENNYRDEIIRNERERMEKKISAQRKSSQRSINSSTSKKKKILNFNDQLNVVKSRSVKPKSALNSRNNMFPAI